MLRNRRFLKQKGTKETKKGECSAGASLCRFWFACSIVFQSCHSLAKSAVFPDNEQHRECIC